MLIKDLEHCLNELDSSARVEFPHLKKLSKMSGPLLPEHLRELE